MADASQTFPSVEETLQHPAYPGTIWALEPHRHGVLGAAVNRGGPVNIAWAIHGSGPVKLVMIMGLAGVKTSWQRQTRYFGHDRGETYSVLLIDNRGMGGSDKPLARYSTSQMALDVLDVLDHVGWTAPRSVNVVGISLGGMIAQELACAAPQRIQSLSLLCTSAHVRSGKSLPQTLVERAGMLKPKAEGDAIADTGRSIFVAGWLAAPDAEDLPVPGVTPRCGDVPGGYRMFENNFQRFQAQELTKRRADGAFTLRGFLCQLVAAGWHRKSDEQLRGMADAVGRERIMVMHGTGDNMITVANGQKLIDVIEPGTGLIVEGMGHAPIMERFKWFNELLEERLNEWTKL
ncbi:hypothetical protein PCL_09940 [Purpureocillium lilacinum]|uniref:AB hydrolase-1 domain-containing protein n=1 Tax=Purpureocillium lilacinum TaxID=33203 RepID=A0A2U3EEI1_PURLI|nr:hypothetical protein PCL_09940 [Purpureocillium lilacinum]GJN70125.1 hypothetical protein PLICBS_004177 [Purpureocillium lilacinum]